MSAHLQAQIRQKLQQIHAVDLQKLAEDLACVKFPNRFGSHILRRGGRNDEDQTTKGWPDAFVVTGSNEVDGVEATRQDTTWRNHLEADLSHAQDPDHRNLSGYVFVGGYPSDAPSAANLDQWLDRFAALGIERSKITILVGSDLVLELCRPEYALVRQLHLGLRTVPDWFRMLGETVISDNKLGLFQPTLDEYRAGAVWRPAITDGVITDLMRTGASVVRGYGAAGKTTLAELVARDPLIAPNPVWYVDISRATDELAGSDLLNAMSSLGAKNTLFIIDNIHIDHAYAARIYDTWFRHLHPIGARILLLGRYTEKRGLRLAGDPPVHELRAGIDEMNAVVGRLALREGVSIVRAPPLALDRWAETFGGSRSKPEIAVDLVAFTAAVDRRLQNLVNGDFRLAAYDAVDAVRARYLQPLTAVGELSNILRLAAVAEFEVPLAEDQIPTLATGFDTAINTLGLVVFEDLGEARRRHYRLIHPALGPLLLEAMGPGFDVEAERLLAASQSPVLGRRISAAIRRSKRSSRSSESFDIVVNNAIGEVGWPQRCHTLQELSNLAVYAVTSHLLTNEQVDEQIVAARAIETLMKRSPSVWSINQFLSRAQNIGFPKSAALIGRVVFDSSFMEMIHARPASEVSAFVRLLPNGSEALAAIDLIAWEAAQHYARSEAAKETVSAAWHFERLDRSELSVAPALQQIRRADPALWQAGFALGHLSRLIRIANASRKELNVLLLELRDAGWLAGAVSVGSTGAIAGALLSLANYLPPELRQHLLVPELAKRVFDELGNLGENGKYLSRPLCLLGGFATLGGQVPNGIRKDWHFDPNAELALDEVSHSEEPTGIGTYELQLWLGIKAINLAGGGPVSVPESRGTSFLRRLRRATPPTSQARRTQEELCTWLLAREATNWMLIEHS